MKNSDELFIKTTYIELHINVFIIGHLLVLPYHLGNFLTHLKYLVKLDFYFSIESS